MRAAYLTVTLAVLAACGKASGTYLEIHVPANAKAVELFLGHDPASSTYIGPPTTDTAFPKGRYYFGEGWTSAEPNASFGTLTGSTLTYRLEGGGTLARLLIVAYDDQDQPIGVKLLDDIPIASHAATLAVDLDPAVPIEAQSNASGSAERVQVWRRPDDESAHQRSACALLWHANDLTGSATEFFVPEDDTDCDGAFQRDSSHMECNSSSEWNYCEVDDTKMGISAAQCMVTTPDSGACRLGGPPMCVDGGDNCVAPDCTPSPVFGCLPPEVCKTASVHNCSTLDPGCLGLAVTLATVPAIRCSSFIDSTGACDMTFDLSASGIFGARSCKQLALQTFGPNGMFGPQVTADGLTYSLSTFSLACSATVTLSGFPTMPVVPTPVFVVIDTLPAPDQYFYVPLQVHTSTGTCTSPSQCAVDGGPAVPCP